MNIIIYYYILLVISYFISTFFSLFLKEAEKTQKLASLALEEAEKTKGEYKKLKTEYEEIVAELRTTLTTLKAGANAQRQKLSLDQSSLGKQTYNSIDRKKSSDKSKQSSDDSKKFDSLKRKTSQSNKEENSTNRFTGYQSLFTRPSSLISGLTNRSSLTKSVSFADQPEKKKDEHEKDKKKTSIKEKEQSSEEKSNHNSLERTNKSQEKGRNQRIAKDYKVFTSSKGKKFHGEAERAMSNEFLDDIPMMDENFENIERSHSSIGFSKLNTVKSENNFDLGKSSSSPSVPEPAIITKPKYLPLSNKAYQSDKDSPRGAHSPESHSSSAVILLSGNVQKPQSSLYRPSSACGQLMRQSSITTVPEDNVITTPPPPTKPRVFAISRQNSTPNLGIQRQNSGASIPLQRQLSLGTVPEENKLPRQDSLLSVQEERNVVDQTLPLSPAGSIQCLPAEDIRNRCSIRSSLELVAGPIIAGSSFQQPVLNFSINNLDNVNDEPPVATSSLKKNNEKRKSADAGVVV